MMHWGNFSGIGYSGFGWIFMMLFWALVILGIVYLVKQLFNNGKIAVEKETAEELLKKKYASGEITRDDFNEKLAAIVKRY